MPRALPSSHSCLVTIWLTASGSSPVLNTETSRFRKGRTALSLAFFSLVHLLDLDLSLIAHDRLSILVGALAQLSSVHFLPTLALLALHACHLRAMLTVEAR